MSLIKRSTGIQSHLASGKKHHYIHTTQQEGQGSATATQKTRFYAPLQYDDKDPAPTKSNKSIFQL